MTGKIDSDKFFFFYLDISYMEEYEEVMLGIIWWCVVILYGVIHFYGKKLSEWRIITLSIIKILCWNYLELCNI